MTLHKSLASHKFDFFIYFLEYLLFPSICMNVLEYALLDSNVHEIVS